MILSHIAACSQNRVIGVNNQLPWNIPEDFQFFKNKTKGHIIIMGRKTFESLPHLLPQRLHIVITRKPESVAPEYRDKIIVVKSLEESIEVAKAHLINTSGSYEMGFKKNLKNWPSEVFIIGGGEIYKQSLGMVDRVYLTIIHQDFNGDASYPDLDPTQFQVTEKSDRNLPLPYTFLTYERMG